jgi:hypothetical protein
MKPGRCAKVVVGTAAADADLAAGVAEIVEAAMDAADTAAVVVADATAIGTKRLAS